MGAVPPDDYYALLGIDADADAAKLRRAWRRLALRWHPDRAGPGATATFQTISMAYTVLSDPVARAAYDRRRAPGVMLSRLTGPLDALLACGVARRAENDIIELFLNAQEAAEGGMASISMRVPVRCPAVDAGETASCARCGARRTIDELFSAWLAVPPGVADCAP